MAISLHKYIAICLGKAISADLLFPDKSKGSILKYLPTVSLIKSLDITFSLSALKSFIIFSANSLVIGECTKDARATILLNTPSNSLIFESTLVAILDKISSSITMLASCAFFLKIAKRVS